MIRSELDQNHSTFFVFALYLVFFFFGHGPRRGQSPVEHKGTFVHPFVRLFISSFVRPLCISLPNQPSHALHLPSQAPNQLS